MVTNPKKQMNINKSRKEKCGVDKNKKNNKCQKHIIERKKAKKKIQQTK